MKGKIKPQIEDVEVRMMAMEIVLHDAKNLLTNITAASELLLLEDISGDEKRRLASLIHLSGREIEILLKGHSLIIQIEKGLYEPTLSHKHVKNRVEWILDEQRKLIDIKGLNVHLADKSSNFLLKTDWFCFDAVLRNVVRNAIQASPVSNGITIEIQLTDSLNIAVHNKGEIPESIQPFFFDKYVTTNATSEGIGLGTYIAKRMMDVLQGDLSFSTSPAEGTTVFIRLPVETPAD